MQRPIALLLAASLAGAGCTAARHPADAMAADTGAAPGDATADGSRHPPAAILLVGAAIAIGIVALALSKHEGSSGMDFVPPSPS